MTAPAAQRLTVSDHHKTIHLYLQPTVRFLWVACLIPDRESVYGVKIKPINNTSGGLCVFIHCSENALDRESWGWWLIRFALGASYDLAISNCEKWQLVVQALERVPAKAVNVRLEQVLPHLSTSPPFPTGLKRVEHIARGARRGLIDDLSANP